MIKHWFEKVNSDNLRALGEEIFVFTSENQSFIMINFFNYSFMQAFYFISLSISDIK